MPLNRTCEMLTIVNFTLYIHFTIIHFLKTLWHLLRRPRRGRKCTGQSWHDAGIEQLLRRCGRFLLPGKTRPCYQNNPTHHSDTHDPWSLFRLLVWTSPFRAESGVHSLTHVPVTRAGFSLVPPRFPQLLSPLDSGPRGLGVPFLCHPSA